MKRVNKFLSYYLRKIHHFFFPRLTIGIIYTENDYLGTIISEIKSWDNYNVECMYIDTIRRTSIDSYRNWDCAILTSNLSEKDSEFLSTLGIENMIVFCSFIPYSEVRSFTKVERCWSMNKLKYILENYQAQKDINC